MTEFEKTIYNKYLAVTRSSQNKPFKLRKNFKDFDDINLSLVKKLSLFFKKFKHVDMDTFFKAPFEIYIDNNGFDLKFYTTQRALKVYTLYMQRQAQGKPDTEEQLYNIKKSLQYILTFCNNKKIEIEDYINHKTNNTFTFLIHLKEHKINIYTLYGFSEFEDNISQIDGGYLRFILGEFVDNLPVFRTNFMSSRIAKPFIRSGLKRLKQLQQSS
tara:strand:- start:224 stop:868 length:645 start_codon:yes stop_codon:yes gene_type:complete